MDNSSELLTYTISFLKTHGILVVFSKKNSKKLNIHLFFLSLKMSLQMGYTDRREVRQFQYTAWPDHGVPDYPGLFTFFNSHLPYVNTFHQKIYIF